MDTWSADFVLIGIGYSLIQQGYHTVPDVLAAVVAGLATIYAFVFLGQLPFIDQNLARLSLYLIPITGLLLSVIAYGTSIPPHSGKAFVGLVGFTIFLLLNERVNKGKKGS